ncbi:hypothetical protein QAD02_010672 [Eretmocerus hayati]|uniref:Uncharacterized protein n=1 Tax=Eretmocerus hayati TaxID=131215 RepID=A0ACC2NUQ8_9HYME|nr:hypothetical protein QAD02_010672 [Eretmocerus hayati]
MGGLAARFSRQVLDRAFRFLQEECINHMSDTGKCSMMMDNASSPIPMIPMSRPTESRRSNSDEPPRRTHPHSSLFEDKFKPSDQDETATRNSQHRDSVRTPTMKVVEDASTHSSTDSRVPVTTSAYNSNFHKSGRVKADTPERGQNRKPEAPRYTSIVDNSVSVASVTQRSPSYGRGIVWTSSPPSTSAVPDWATSFWYSYTQDTTTDEIYPAPGIFGGNNIDEPNQQGLSKNAQIRSSQPILRSILVLFVLCGILA